MRMILAFLLMIPAPAQAGWLSSSPSKACQVQFADDPNFALSFGEKVGLALFIPPLLRTWGDRDKRYFAFWESPLRGIPDQFVGITLARLLAGEPVLDPQFFANFKDSYLGYQVTNLFRIGVNLENRISDRYALFLNWYYSAISYGLITAGPVLASAQSQQQEIYGWSLITYSMIWPLFSQTMSRKLLVPVLFSRFPRKSDLDRIFSRSVTTAEIMQDLEGRKQVMLDKIASTEEAIKTEDSHDLKLKLSAQKMELTNINATTGWTRFFRRGLAAGQAVPKRRRLQFAFTKQIISSGIAAAMISIYFVGRWGMVGPTLEDPGFLRTGIESMVHETESVFGPSELSPAEQGVINGEAAGNAHQNIANCSRETGQVFENAEDAQAHLRACLLPP